MAGADEKLNAEFSFLRFDLLAQWRLLDMQCFSRAREAALIGNGYEVTEMS
ncbi:hypothetical protein AA0488_2167 [Kozakia baliensis NRIC 0488]|nr:hypothetical protein AA0488_2167 [Kozakia baliensis NRIC 0488]